MIKKKVTEKELREIIKTCAVDADLNFLDVSDITDMSKLFEDSKFNGNISGWDVGAVENMEAMFSNSKFNGDLSKWNVSKVENMISMFYNSKFNGDISKWDMSNVKYVSCMFYNSKFNGDISKWDVSNAYGSEIFYKSKFSGDVSGWSLSKLLAARDLPYVKNKIIRTNCSARDNNKYFCKILLNLMRSAYDTSNPELSVKHSVNDMVAISVNKIVSKDFTNGCEVLRGPEVLKIEVNGVAVCSFVDNMGRGDGWSEKLTGDEVCLIADCVADSFETLRKIGDERLKILNYEKTLKAEIEASNLATGLMELRSKAKYSTKML